MLRLHALGGLYLERDGVRVDGGATQRKRLTLLAVLAAEQSGATREKIAALLWPESDDAHSRNALYQSVAAIRRELGTEILIGSPTGDLRLNPELLTSDISEFQDALARGDLERAVAAYDGAFLDGVHIRSAPEFERWVETTSRSYHRRYQEVLGELAERASASGAYSGAAEWIRRLAEADPLNAGVVVRLMEALAAAGEREAAIRHGTIYLELVRAELEVEPDARVVRLLTDLRHRDDATERQRAVAPMPLRAEVTELPTADLTSQRSSTDRAAPGQPRRWRWRLVAALVITGAGASALMLTRPARLSDSANASLDPKAVVVADFENLTGDSSFTLLGATLGDWVTQGVMQTGVARVIDPASRAVVGRLGSGMSKLNGKARVFAIAKAAAAGLVVSGTIYRRGAELAIHAQLTDVRNDQVLASLDPIAAPIGFPLQNADLLRERIAGAIASAFDSRLTMFGLRSGHPPTFAAYQEYILGLDVFLGINEDQAVSHFIRAAQLDTTWGLPLVWAAFAFGNSGRRTELDSVVTALEKRRKFLGPLEELHLQDLKTKGDENLLVNVRGAKLSPGSTWSMGAGNGMHNRNRMREAIAYYQQIDPEHGWVGGWFTYWLYYTRALHAVGDYRDELSVIRRYLALAPSDLLGSVIEIRALASLGDLTEARRRLAELLRRTDSGCAESADWNHQLALELTRHADSADADSIYRQMLYTCQRDDERLAAFADVKDSVAARALIRTYIGVALYRTGRLEEAKRALEWAITEPAADAGTRLEATKFLGRIAARQGDRAGAERAMHAFPLLDLNDESYSSIEYAAIAVLLGDRERAMQRLVAASDRLPYAGLHRDPDFDSLRGFPPFDALIAPK